MGVTMTEVKVEREPNADVVIVGGGSAGALLAARLSEEPARRVLLIEAGGEAKDPDIWNPAAWPALWATRETSARSFGMFTCAETCTVSVPPMSSLSLVSALRIHRRGSIPRADSGWAGRRVRRADCS